MDNSYVKMEHRLAIGVEPIDAVRGGRLVHPVRVDVERTAPHSMAAPAEAYSIYGAQRKAAQQRRRVSQRYASDKPPRFDRHDSCLHALLYRPGLQDRLTVRVYDHYRRYVPRRFSLPILSSDTVDTLPYTHRVRRPVLFPGAAYDVSKNRTGIRARIMRGGVPFRWARVEAFLPGTTNRVGMAFGDDRGEFLMLLAAEATPFSELNDPLDVTIAVSGYATVLPAPSAEIEQNDPLWDVPVEEVPVPGADDDVSAGEVFPGGYGTFISTLRTISVTLGRITTGVDDFIIT